MLLADLDIVDSINNFFSELFAWLPRAVGALAVLVAGYFIAKALGHLIARLLQRIGLDRWVERGFGGSRVSRVVSSPSELLGTVAFWVIFIAALSIAVDILGIETLENAVAAVWGYIPNVLSALAILLLAAVLAGGVSRLIARAMPDSGTGRLLGTIAPLLIMAIAVFMALDQLEIASNIVVITYASLMGALGLGLALAFGLGGRDVAAEVLQGAYVRGKQALPEVRREVQDAQDRLRRETP